MFKKNVIGIFFTTFMIISSISTAHGLEKGIVSQCDYLNVRKGPSTKYSILSKLYTNNVIEIVEKSGNWYKVKTSSNIERWVRSKYIRSYNEVHVTTSEVKQE